MIISLQPSDAGWTDLLRILAIPSELVCSREDQLGWNDFTSHAEVDQVEDVHEVCLEEVLSSANGLWQSLLLAVGVTQGEAECL